MKSAYLFAFILAPTCIFAQPLDHDEEKNSKPDFARDVLEERSPQTAIGNEQSSFTDQDGSNSNTPPPEPPSNSNTTDISGPGAPPVGHGEKSGNQISTYVNANCEGPSVSNISLTYDVSIVNQLQSYYLAMDLGAHDAMGAYADINWNLDVFKPIDPSLDGDQNFACAQYAYDLTGALGTDGCHTLNNTVGCIMIGIKQNVGG